MTRKTDLTARERVLRAALHEFATRGYEAASTNAMAEAAGVAKGLVFHHFGSKEKLFEAVFTHAFHEVNAALLAQVGPMPADLFERLHAWSVRKVSLMRERPEVFELFVVALTEAPAPLRRTLSRLQARLFAEAWPRVLDGVDAGRLRAGVSLEDAVETLTILADGLEKRLVSRLRAGEKMETVAAYAWTHFERLRDGLSGPAAASPSRASRASPRGRPAVRGA